METILGDSLASYILDLCPDESVRIETSNLQTTATLMDRDLSFIISRYGCVILPNPNCYVYDAYDWQHRRELIKSMIRHRLGLSTRFYARTLKVKPVSQDEYDSFMEISHPSGTVSAVVVYGLYHKDGTLISVMSFAKQLTRRGYHWWIMRYATRPNTAVSGGASKLFTYFIREVDPPLVYNATPKTSEAVFDRDFKMFRETKPSYYCRDQITGLYVGRLKSILIKFLDMIGLQIPGFDRVWNSGAYQMVWKKPNN